MPAPFDTERELRRHGKAMRQLAHALLRYGADADDVTQAAWLTALQSPPPQQTSHGGWLQTVVRRLAGRMRRSRSRRLAREVAAARPEAVPAADELAARSELLHRVVDAVQRLDEPYRATVWQRYFEELPPSLIAQQSGVPVATVKSRLQRGLALLRQRLDQGGEGGEWRQGLAVAFGIGGGVRVGAAAAAGVLLMGTAVKVLLGGGAAVAAIVALSWATAERPVRPAADAQAGLAPTPYAAPTAASAPQERTERSPAPATAADQTLVHLRGRCVDPDGRPLSGVAARLHGSTRRTNRIEPRQPVEWRDPTPVVTGDDGSFAFAFAAAARLEYDLALRMPGHLPRAGSWSSITASIELGDITLTPGLPVRGRVVDGHGAAVAGATVVIENLPKALAAGMSVVGRSHGTSSANGEFCILDPIPVGSWPLALESAGLRLLAPDRANVSADGAAPLLVTVQRMPSIEGIVVDESGAPVEGATIRADLGREGRQAGGTSQKDGTFTMFAVDAQPKPVRLLVDDPGPCEPSWHEERLWPWGSRDVRIVLQRALSFELTVVERATGAAVRGYAVSCYNERSRSSRDSDYRLAGEHRDGRTTVDDVWRGHNSLLVMPLDPALQPSQAIAFEATDAGMPAMRVELERLLPTRVRVVTNGGDAVTGSKVEVVAPGTRPFDAHSVAYDLRLGARDWTPERAQRHELISSAVTGPDGSAQVFRPVDTRVVLRVTGGHATAIVDCVVPAPGSEVTVVLPESGGVVGSVRWQGLDPTRMSIELCGSDRRWLPGAGGSRLQPDGTFAFCGLSPGRFQVRVRYAGSKLDLNVPDVFVEAGRDTTISIDATSLAPASVRGRVLLDGAVPSPARVVICRRLGSQTAPLVLDATGSFELTGLLPGTYDAMLLVGDLQATSGDPILQEETFILANGEQLARDFTFARQRLVVTIVEADGKTPAAGVRLEWSVPVIRRTWTTDAQGVLVLDPAPHSRVILRTQAGSNLPLIEIPAGRSEYAVTLRLPAGK